MVSRSSRECRIDPCTTSRPIGASKGDCRHIGVLLDAQGGRWNCTISMSPPAATFRTASNPKFAHKLDFVAEARHWFAARTAWHARVLVGDLNIAPLEHDVWSHRQLLSVVSHTPPEAAGLTAWQDTGFVDAVRHFVPADQKLYTWWSYRNRDWRASDRGRRLDHIWVTPDLAGKLERQIVLKDARDWPQGVRPRAGLCGAADLGMTRANCILRHVDR